MLYHFLRLLSHAQKVSGVIWSEEVMVVRLSGIWEVNLLLIRISKSLNGWLSDIGLKKVWAVLTKCFGESSLGAGNTVFYDK